MSSDEPVTKDDLNRVIKYFKKQVERLDGQISDAFQAISDAENAEVQLVDEAVRKADRAQRTANRVKKRLDEMEAE